MKFRYMVLISLLTLTLILTAFIKLYAQNKELPDKEIQAIVSEIFDKMPDSKDNAMVELERDTKDEAASNLNEEATQLFECQNNYRKAVLHYNNERTRKERLNNQIHGMLNEKKAIEDQIESKKVLLNSYMEHEETLKRGLQQAMPPILYVHLIAFATSPMNQQWEEIASDVKAEMGRKAQNNYITSYEEHTNNDKVILTSSSSTITRLFEPEKIEVQITSINEPDTEKESEKKTLYLLSWLYAVEQADNSSSFDRHAIKSEENHLSNNDKNGKVTFIKFEPCEPANLIPDGYKILREDKKALLDIFCKKYESMAKRYKKLNDNQKKQWTAFQENLTKIQNMIEENREYSIAKLEKQISDLERQRGELDTKIENLDKQINVIIASLPDLEKDVDQSKKELISNLSERKLTIVVSCSNKDKTGVVKDILDKGHEQSKVKFIETYIKVVIGKDDIEEIKRNEISRDISSKLINKEWLAWTKESGNDGESKFVLLAKFSYQIKQPEPSLLPDYNQALIKCGDYYCDPYSSREWLLVENLDFDWKEAQELLKAVNGNNFDKNLLTKKAIHWIDTHKSIFGGWQLPSLEAMKSIQSNKIDTVSRLPVIRCDITNCIPYWTRDKHADGNHYGYCFGKELLCAPYGALPFKHSRSYPGTRVLGLLLTRNIEK